MTKIVLRLKCLLPNTCLLNSKCCSAILFHRTYCTRVQSIATNSELKSSNAENTVDEFLCVKGFIEGLSDEKRKELLFELQKIEALKVTKKAEAKLASWRWRSRFGRPSSFQKLGADPTGTYCAIPENWLKEKTAIAMKPTMRQLRQLALFNALPFIGFGFLDNLIMIVAGDYIDASIGTAFGISTMAAAALGNTISDVAGIGSGFYVEAAAEKFGVHAPNLSQQQLETVRARWSANIGRAIGVVLGCILGMIPLLFMTTTSEAKHSPKSDQFKT